MLPYEQHIGNRPVKPALKIDEDCLADRLAPKRLHADIEKRLVVSVVKCLRHRIGTGQEILRRNALSAAAAQKLVSGLLEPSSNEEGDKSGPVGPRVIVEIDFGEVAVDGFIFRIVKIIGEQHLPDRIPEVVGKETAPLHLPEGIHRSNVHGLKLSVPHRRGEPESRAGDAEGQKR